MNRVVIYTDGACIGNPGPGGYGLQSQTGSHQKKWLQAAGIFIDQILDFAAGLFEQSCRDTAKG